MVSLVVGPFLILLLFGEGVGVGAPRPKTVVVQPASQSEQTSLTVSPAELQQYLTVVATTNNEQQAQQMLVDGAVDLVIVLPQDPVGLISSGKHAPLRILTNIIDPVRKSYADAYIREQVATLNQRAVQKTLTDVKGSIGDVHGFTEQAGRYIQLIQSTRDDIIRSQTQVHQMKATLDPISGTLQQTVSMLQASPLALVPALSQPLAQVTRLSDAVDTLKSNVDAIDQQLTTITSDGTLPTNEQIVVLQKNLNDVEALVTQVTAIPPDVLSAPFTVDIKNIAPFVPTAIGYYAPAVLALLIQHLAVTLGALSMTRIRLLGLMELFQTSPVKPVEVALGNYIAYASLCIIAAALLVVLLTAGLGVPVFGSVYVFAATLLLLVLCSLGIGFIISMISSSEQQAAQIAMLVLISSVFFSGFLVSLDSITMPVRIVSYLLPATYSMRTLQDVMLRGVMHTPDDLIVLTGTSVILFLVTVILLNREFRPR